MFCCCSEESNTHSAEESNRKPNKTTPANTQPSNGAVSTPNQTSGGGATVGSQAKAAVTQQPAAQSNSATSRSQPEAQKDLNSSRPASRAPEELKSAAVKVSDIQVKVADTESSNRVSAKSLSQGIAQVDSAGKAVSSLSAEQKLGSIEPQKVDPKAFISNMPNIELLKSVNSELDKLDKAIGEAEAKSQWEAKSSVHKLANQLKALTSQVLTTTAGSGKMGDSNLQAVVSRLEAVASRLEAVVSRTGGGQSAAGDSGAVSPYVVAYDDIVSGPLAKFLSLSNDIGGDVKSQAGLVKEAFDAQRSFLVVASKSKQPDQNTFVELLKPSASKLQAVQDFRENNRRSEYFNHLSAISESIAALGWVTITPAPGPYVKEMSDAGTFYTNRVLKDYKEKDPKHAEWSRSWLATLTELQAYIKQFHTTGLSWNPQGGDARAAQSSGAKAVPPPPAGGAPPPPPPGPPPPPDTSASSKGDDDGPGRSALFAEINKGGDVTKGLKKVTDDMKTHKNPTLRQGPAPFKPTAAPKPNTSPKPAAKAQTAPSHPPVTELQGKKWVVEYHKGNKNIVLDNVDIKQTIYIYKCEDCVIKVVGKVNSIVVDSSKKTGIVFDDLVSSLEFVNCQSMQAQVTGKIPTLSIDKTDGCLMYLSLQSLNVEIVTAKSSEMNILVPVGNGDYKEFALPEQYKSTYDGKAIVTTPSDIA